MRWENPSDASVVVEDAEILGHCSTAREDRPRWVEITVIGADCSYVVYGVGKSKIPGETDRPWSKWFPTADLMIRSLLSVPPSGRNATTADAKAMLREASELDEDIADALARWRG